MSEMAHIAHGPAVTCSDFAVGHHAAGVLVERADGHVQHGASRARPRAGRGRRRGTGAKSGRRSTSGPREPLRIERNALPGHERQLVGDHVLGARVAHEGSERVPRGEELRLSVHLGEAGPGVLRQRPPRACSPGPRAASLGLAEAGVELLGEREVLLEEGVALEGRVHLGELRLRRRRRRPGGCRARRAAARRAPRSPARGASGSRGSG